MGTVNESFKEVYQTLDAALTPVNETLQARSREIVALANEALKKANTPAEKNQLGLLLGRISDHIKAKEHKISSVFSRSLPELKKIEQKIIETQNQLLDQKLKDWVHKGSKDGTSDTRKTIAETYFSPAKTRLITTLDLSNAPFNKIKDLPDIFGHPGFSQLKSLTLPHAVNNPPSLPNGCDLIIKNNDNKSLFFVPL